MRYRDDRGFMVITLLALLPLVISLILLVTWTYLLLKADGEARHACRVDLLSAQKQIGQDLKSLLALNPEASRLRAELAAINKVLIATPHPAAHAALEVARQKIIAQQLILAAKQRALIVKAKSLSLTAPSKAMVTVQSALAKNRRSSGKPNLGAYKAGTFDVTASPKRSLTPDYNPSARFRDEQIMRLTWKMDVFAILPTWLKDLMHRSNLFPNGDFHLRAECAATLEKEGTAWSPRLTKDRS